MRALTLTLLLLVFPLPASAYHGVGRCEGGHSSGALGIIQVGAGTPEATFYIDDRELILGNGVWLYTESNGVFEPKPLQPSVPPIQYWYYLLYPWISRYGDAHANLQRGGEAFWSSSAVPEQYRDRETCTDIGDYAPDTLIY